MSKHTLAAAIGAALTTLVTVSAASAAQPGPAGTTFQCQSQMTGAKTHPLVFNCNAQTPQGIALLRPANCDPATMSWGAMQADCKALTAAQQDKAPATGG
jgi:hypothetical protein